MMAGDEIRTNRLARLLREGPLDQAKSFAQGMSNAAASNVSGPVDALAWLLRKTGLPIPQNPMGGSEWMAEKGLTAAPNNRLAGLLGEGAGLSAPIAAFAKAPQIAGGLLALDDHAMEMARRGVEGYMNKTGMIQPATVWHGSPHKFDKFDASKIGTGEGAQVKGHGLYVGEAEQVGKEYMRALAGKDNGLAGQIAADALRGRSPESAMEYLARAAGSTAESQSAAKQAIDLIRSGKANTGYLYKVDLPDNAIAKMLDYDRPLHRQAPEVRKAVRGVVDETLGPGAYGGLIKNRPDIKDLQNNALEGLTQAQIAEKLRQRGIPGIRYLDGGSRGAGSGTSNYVVFPGNEDLLQILERNGVPIK
jgi:hypothetical protein